MTDVVSERTTGDGRERQTAGVATADAVTDTAVRPAWTGGDPCVPGRPDLKLKTYRVEVEDGEVVVYL